MKHTTEIFFVEKIMRTTNKLVAIMRKENNLFNSWKIKVNGEFSRLENDLAIFESAVDDRYCCDCREPHF